MINIAKMFGWLNYMKYEEMANITANMFKNSNENEVNVYLDLGSMTDGLYGNIVERSNDPTELTAVVINLAAHIRAYFRSVHSVYATVFLVYSSNNWSILKNVCKEYNSNNNKDSKKYMNKYIKDSMSIAEQICYYIPNVYFINSNAECGAVIYSTILKERLNGNNHPNIIFTKEYNLLQIPTIDNNSVIYYKQAMYRSKVCFGINKDNAMEQYIKLTKRYNPVFADPDAMVYVQLLGDDISKAKFISKSKRMEHLGRILKVFDSRLLSYFIALTNLPSRGLKYVLSWSTAMEVLYKLQNDYIDDAEWIYNNICYEAKIFNKIGYEEFINRYRCIDIRYQSMLYDQEHHKEYRIDLINSNELKYLNDHYFIKNYIDLNKF